MKYGIDPKVWKKIIGRYAPTLPRIMFAAALDPLLIHDLDEIPEPQSLIECLHLGDMGTRGDLRNYLRGVLAAWIMEQEDARAAIRPIAEWDQRLGVWLAAAAVETVLRFIPRGEERPARAVQVARDWVYVLATARDIAAARTAASDAAEAAYASRATDYTYVGDADAASIAADSAASAASAAYRAASAPAYNVKFDAINTAIAAYAAVAQAVAADAYDTRHADPSVGMRETLVNAVWTYPLD